MDPEGNPFVPRLHQALREGDFIDCRNLGLRCFQGAQLCSQKEDILSCFHDWTVDGRSRRPHKLERFSLCYLTSKISEQHFFKKVLRGSRVHIS